MDSRMTILRCLQSPTPNPTPEVQWLVKQCHSLVIECLVNFSRGVTSTLEGKDGVEKTQTYYPYGPYVGKETRFFKKNPSPHFGMTLATMYPFVATEQSLWDLKLKEKNYPITKLWPYPTMCRYMNFVKNFVNERETMFQNYEDDGGEYLANDEDSDSDKEEEESDSDKEDESDTEDEDNVFSQM